MNSTDNKCHVIVIIIFACIISVRHIPNKVIYEETASSIRCEIRYNLHYYLSQYDVIPNISSSHDMNNLINTFWFDRLDARFIGFELLLTGYKNNQIILCITHGNAHKLLSLLFISIYTHV